MKKKILLLTDFSKIALNAIMYALELNKTDRCDFYVLNTFKTRFNLIEDIIPPQAGESGYDIPKNESLNRLKHLSKLIEFHEDENPYHTFSYLSINKPLLKAVIETVDLKDIELVIMGTKGITDNNSSVFGSNAIEIMEKVRNCPVLVIPEKANRLLPKEIVFPTNFKINYKKRELNYLIEIAKKCNSAIRILHINNKDGVDKNLIDNQKRLEEYFQGIKYSIHLLSGVSVSAGIRCFVDSRESDMITFINRKHKFFGSILTQPLVKNIGYKLKVPVLVLHDLNN
ncbi:Nucleotide-binding universal stress UspA family protein [Tenacibaculum sp. 190524A02b]|uniref:Nucleotide-binding universal stress UspA family protein n=1 Tax=Tenacibaculum vairaonense TaxID=3137860 RepID=A0ABM9PPN2_9FLAO